jgi:(1->4)-alpha-D-glucan 1-alpha-D-glucosylmutase
MKSMSTYACFVDGLYEHEAFLKDFARFHRKVAYFGALSSLSQAVLKITSPGVPDFYRGTGDVGFQPRRLG